MKEVDGAVANACPAALLCPSVISNLLVDITKEGEEETLD